MSAGELRKRLIEKIQTTDNVTLLHEAYRLLQLEAQDLDVYKLSVEQKSAVEESRLQIKSGKSITNDQSDREIDEWLNK